MKQLQEGRDRGNASVFCGNLRDSHCGNKKEDYALWYCIYMKRINPQEPTNAPQRQIEHVPGFLLISL